jgi:hypothetical protein
MPYPRRFHRLPLLLVLAAGLATGAACGGSGSGSNGVASIKTASDQSGDSTDKDSDKKETSPEDAMLAFARCMREHGIDMPDPDTSGGNGVVTFSASAAGEGAKLDPEADKFREANDACKDLMGDVGPMNMSPEQQQEMQDQALAFSRCMREHGVNMPDPTFGGKGEMMMKIGPDDGLDPEDPKFQDAQQACGSAFGPGGGKGGPGLSVGGVTADGGTKSEGPRGAIMFGGATAGPSSGGGK